MSAEFYLRAKALPLARTQHPFAFARTSCGGEDESQADISRRIRQNVRRVGDDHPSLSSSGRVDVVIPNTEITEDLAPHFPRKSISRERIAQGRQDRVVSRQSLCRVCDSQRITVRPNSQIKQPRRLFENRFRDLARDE